MLPIINLLPIIMIKIVMLFVDNNNEVNNCDDHYCLDDAAFGLLWYLVFGSQYFGVHLANCDLWPTYGFYNTSIFLCSG